MQKNGKVLIVVSLLVVLASGFVFAGGGAETASSGETKQKVMLYSSLKDSQLAAIKEGFMKKYPNITMDYYTAGTGNVMTKLATEQQAGGISADIIWVGDPTNYIDFKEQGLLMPYDSPAAASIPDKFKDPDRLYMSARLIMLGFVYNTNLVKGNSIPKTWEDLLKPEFKDYVAMTDPTTSGTTLFTVAGLVQNPRYGWSYFEKLKANGVKLENGSSGVVNKAAAGEYKVSIGVDYIARTVMAQGATIGFVYPDNDIPIIESPIAIIKNTKNVEAAKKLYDYIISEDGQSVLLEEYTMPINPNMKLENAIDVNVAEAKMLTVDPVVLVRDKLSMLEKFDSIFK
ncbi:MAG: ABC transporter substrate-binding protein [Sphaerochaeta sp.]|jgi:iron(III) transport system substrate-binding protein|nr:ABC transporter substrate-binding protein [Sphaerochaeta sp.]PKL28690.1 MAG: ABC transporter substrate-binding protein [Spirochaetae bacterium HGW-Spirochaetae-2]